MLIRFPDGPGSTEGWTVADAVALDRTDKLRVELKEGAFLMVPPASPAHQRVSLQLSSHLYRQGLEVYQDIGIEIDNHNYRIPDIIILRPHAALVPDENEQPASLVEIAIEIVSPSSRDEDRINKPKIYAKAGIPRYWRLEPGPDGYTVLMHDLVDDEYRLTREVALLELLEE